MNQLFEPIQEIQAKLSSCSSIYDKWESRGRYLSFHPEFSTGKKHDSLEFMFIQSQVSTSGRKPKCQWKWIISFRDHISRKYRNWIRTLVPTPSNYGLSSSRLLSFLTDVLWSMTHWGTWLRKPSFPTLLVKVAIHMASFQTYWDCFWNERKDSSVQNGYYCMHDVDIRKLEFISPMMTRVPLINTRVDLNRTKPCVKQVYKRKDDFVLASLFDS